MAQLNQGQTGKLRSTPKQLNIKAADKFALLFKNMGNNHNQPFLWSGMSTVVSGTNEVTIASGIKFYDMDLATYGSFTVTPNSNPGYAYWVEQDVVNNVVKLVTASGVADDVVFNVQTMLGADADISIYSTRGTGSPSQCYP